VLQAFATLIGLGEGGADLALGQTRYSGLPQDTQMWKIVMRLDPRQSLHEGGGALLMAVIGFKLFLQAQYLLVALVQAPCQAGHDVPLLHQEALVAVHLHNWQRLSTVSTDPVSTWQWHDVPTQA